MSTQLLKRAIAEARTLRETAILNAKTSLEESLTPHIKRMLSQKLQEELEETEETIEEGGGVPGFTEVKPKQTNKQVNEEEDDSEESEDNTEETLEEPETEVPEEEDIVSEPEESLESGEISDEQELGDLSVGQFRELFRELIAAEVGGENLGEPEEAEETPEDVDFEPGEVEGMGEEEPPTEDIPGEEIEQGEDDEEIDLDEILREIEGIGKKPVQKPAVVSESVNKQEVILLKQKIRELESQLQEATETVKVLTEDIKSTNLLNAKLLYVNRIFKASNLTESQKVHVVSAFDGAETIKEVKLVYETLVKGSGKPVLGTEKKLGLRENKGLASKATGLTAKKPETIVEADQTVLRMQKLAGIIKD